VRQREAEYLQRVTEDFALTERVLKDGFPAGAFVMLKEQRQGAAFNAKYSGPYKVLRRTRGGAYVLLDATGTLLPRNVAPQHLKLIDPAGVHADESPSYEVEAILDHRGPVSDREYLVRWQGYDSSSDSWEKASSFDTHGVIDEYWRRRGSPPAAVDSSSSMATAPALRRSGRTRRPRGEEAN
jgi:hypothetical protein